jgi:molecular chaperone DnaK (HSP70)
LKNEADSLIYQTEKQITEHADKLPDTVKDQVKGDVTALNEAIASNEA